MDDFNFWWYIIAAVIYFLTRSKKKKPQESRPGSENNPPSTQRPKSFEELLREITEGARTEEAPKESKQEPVVITQPESPPKEQDQEAIRLEGERRAFADEESRRVYEESIKMAEGADIAFERDEHFRQSRLFRGDPQEEDERSYAVELMDGFDADEAKKAIIYAEILNRRY